MSRLEDDLKRVFESKEEAESIVIGDKAMKLLTEALERSTSLQGVLDYIKDHHGEASV